MVNKRGQVAKITEEKVEIIEEKKPRIWLYIGILLAIGVILLLIILFMRRRFKTLQSY